MPAFTRQFSASVGWRSQVVMKTSVGSASQGRLDRLAVGKIHGDVLHALGQVVLVAGNAGNRPALRRQMLRQMAANNAENAGDERVAIS